MRMRSLLLLTLMAPLLLSVQALAGTKANPDLKGWEQGGEYDKLFDLKEADTLKGKVTKIMEVVPFSGMAPGIALQIEDKKDKGLETVHLGPKEGDQVKVAGVWAELDGQDVMLATKVKKDENIQLKVRRTKDGFPFWNMTPEERAREQGDD